MAVRSELFSFFGTSEKRDILDFVRREVRIPGNTSRPFNPEFTPYLSEIYRCFMNDETREIVLMFSSQVAKTQFMLNVLMYVICESQGSCMWVMPTQDNVVHMMREKINPQIDAMPEVKKRVFDSDRSRRTSNTKFFKEFAGGFLKLSGSNSPTQLQSSSIQYMFMDELDKMTNTVAGDPVQLAKQRTETFHNRKIIKTSTPLEKDTSRIFKEFQASKRHYYQVPCPTCGTYQVLEWENFRFTEEGQWVKPHFVCVLCDNPIDEEKKALMLREGKWVVDPEDAADEHKSDKKVGFHIWSAYSMLTTWEWIVDKWRDVRSVNTRASLMWFFNETLGQPFEDLDNELMNLELSRNVVDLSVVPNQVKVITAGVDIQKDYVALEFVGFDAKRRSYSLAYKEIRGNVSEMRFWEDVFFEEITRKFRRQDGAMMGISGVCIDSGNNAQLVYQYCKKYAALSFFAIKGSDTLSYLVGKSQDKEKRYTFYNVAVAKFKDAFFSYVKVQNRDEYGYCFFNAAHATEKFFSEITGEHVVESKNKTTGQVRRLYKRKSGVRNEALDCRVYAMACLEILGYDLESIDAYRELEIDESRNLKLKYADLSNFDYLFRE